MDGTPHGWRAGFVGVCARCATRGRERRVNCTRDWNRARRGAWLDAVTSSSAPQRRKGSAPASEKNAKRKTCTYCRRTGHNARTCPEMIKEGKGWPSQACTHCGVAGHNRRCCPELLPGTQRGDASETSNAGSCSTRVAEDACSFCKGRQVVRCLLCSGLDTNTGAPKSGKPFEFDEKEVLRARARRRLFEKHGVLVQKSEAVVCDSSLRSASDEVFEWLHSSTHGAKTCRFCHGIGYLPCLACTEDADE